MPPALVFMLLTVALVAYVVVVARWYRRKQQKKLEGHGAGPPVETRPQTPPMPSAPPLMPLAPEGGSLASTQPPAPADLRGAAPAADRPPDRPQEGPPMQHAGPPGPPALPTDRGTLPTPTTSGSTGASRVVHLVAGIRLPEDLVPQVDVIPRPAAADRAVFVTVESPGDVIRRRMAVALDEIGTDVQWADDGSKALLRRGPHAGWLEIHVTSDGIVEPGTLQFPTLPPHAVLVEIWTEGGAVV